jgi:folate-dependent phosphoribosylglycinamide formyltransferase PurN
MSNHKLKVIVLTHGGVNRVLEFLSELENIEITGVYVEAQAAPQRSLKEKIKRSIKYDGYWETVKKFSAKLLGGKTLGEEATKSVEDQQKEVGEFAKKLGIPIYHVSNYHSAESIRLLQEAEADLGVIYGTNIIKENVFSIPKLGSINLHQGFAPIYRGGPTVFWELFNDEKELGITVHFVAAKVDTGDIILQKTFPLEYDFTKYGLDFDNFLQDYRAGLKEPSARLLADAVNLIAEGREKRLKQDISLGKRYRLPIKAEKDELKRRLRKRQQDFQKNILLEEAVKKS